MRAASCLLVVAAAVGPRVAPAATLPCAPCAGVRVGDPSRAVEELMLEPRLEGKARLYVAWTVALDGSADRAVLESVRAAGAAPWVRAVFRTPQPIGDHLEQLEAELRELAALVRGTGEGLSVQAVWRPMSGEVDAKDHAFLLKRAAVAVTGAAANAAFTVGPLAADPEGLRALYREDVAAYLDGIVLIPGAGLEAAVSTLAELDPGKPVALDALPWPADPGTTLARAAEAYVAGIALTFFAEGPRDIVGLAPLKVLAREFAGELAFSETAVPRGAQNAWTFIDEDLGLHVIAEPTPGLNRLELLFDDPQLRSPTRIDPVTGEEREALDLRRTRRGLSVTVHDPGRVVVLRLEWPSVQELQGFEDLIEVATERQMPVEEILRRLQAFEDDQARRLDHYQARNTLHLRFQGERASIEASYAGDFFFARDEGFDWVWEEFSIGGVRWRSKRLPELPLIQPEKAASLPVEIRLTKDYAYRLRGTATVDGRQCWVIDFKPIAVAPGRSLFQGTVWVDREIFARVRTRAIQVGLEGDVISSEETLFFEPVDDAGRAVDWSRESFVLPLRITGQQTLSLAGATVPVEREIVIADLRVNGDDFVRNRDAARASDLTMVRDTADGLRYLRKDEAGQRVVESEQDTSRLFAVGGVLWDESLDFPLPLAGINYLDLDFRDSGRQLNVFFAGAFLNANLSDPALFGSRWNAGVNVSGFFINRGDELYRDGVEAPEEEIESRRAAGAVFVGRPLGSFLKLDLRYRLRHDTWGRADDTAPEFVLPWDTATHMLRADLAYNRAGYSLGLSGSVHSRSDWQLWGLPGNDEYAAAHKEYRRWQATFAKTWWLSSFRNFSVSVEHLGGSDLDRFSGYDFGLFGDSSVAGYQSGLVRADEANGLHLEYGINIFDAIRFEVEGDAVWASNDATGLDNELLAGIGLGGTVTLPWQVISSFEVGVALAGPGKGDVALRVFFLKLFAER